MHHKFTSLLSLLAAFCFLTLGLPAFAESGTVTVAYPANMQEKGYTESVVLDKMPERVVSIATTPVLALYRLGVSMVGIPASSVVTWPEDLTAAAEQLVVGHGSNFDIETVVAMEPDLVIMGYTSQETYGAVCEGAGIPVYYVDAGHTVSYESIKQQTEALIEAFGPESTAGAEVMASFSDLEARLESVKTEFTGKTVMVLQSSPPDHYIQTAGGTLGSMAEMLGFTNVYENAETSMVLVDYEQAIGYDPDLVLAVGASATGEEHRTLMETDFKNNPDYWNSIPAIARGDIIYLPVSYVASAGINVIDNINALIDTIGAHYAK